MNVTSRPALRPSIPQQQPQKSGWLKRAFDVVKETISGPQLTPTKPQGVDSYSAAGRRDINAPRSLTKLCSTGKGGGSKVLNTISNEYYLQLCDEIGNYSESPAPTRQA